MRFSFLKSGFDSLWGHNIKLVMAQSSNKNLRQANKAKKDEFYTQLSDIEKELKHHKNYFKNKVVYCNADDPFESNFF